MDAQANLRNSWTVCDVLAKSKPNTMVCCCNLSKYYIIETHELGPRHMEVANLLFEIAKVLGNLGELEEQKHTVMNA